MTIAKMLGDMIFLTNLTLDADNWDEVRKLGLPMGTKDDPDHPLTDAELELLGEGGETVAGIEFADLELGHSVLLNGVKCACPTIEFHFRNDKTRCMWGTPTTLETHLPKRDFQSRQARNLLSRMKVKCRRMGGDAAIDYHPIETEDRFTLYMCIPFLWLAKVEIKTHNEFLAFMRGLLQ